MVAQLDTASLCSRCLLPFDLLVHVGREDLCAACWRVAGEPAPPPSPPDQTHEQRIRENMMKKGGAFLHHVKAGQS